MKPKKLDFSCGDLFKKRLSAQLNPKNPVYKLTGIIDWDFLEKSLAVYFPATKGAPAKPIRLIAGLLLLQHAYGFSDRLTLETWVENPYWQFFCGYDYLQWELPMDPSSMTRWRKRIGEEGLKAILNATVKAGKAVGIIKDESLKKVIVDTTVMEKNIAHPTDNRLYLKSLQRMVAFAEKNEIKLRQTYTRTGKRLSRLVATLAHSKKMKKAKKELRHLKTITGRVFRELSRWSAESEKNKEKADKLLTIVGRILLQERGDSNKIYSVHEPSVQCISKGKAHKKYEFGCKASLVITHKEGFALACEAHEGNPYDGHTLSDLLKTTERFTGVSIETVFVDKGYRGHTVENKNVLIPGKKKLSSWLNKQMNRRQSIEPRIGHMKNEGKLGRNFLRGVLGDKFNAILCGIGENLRILLRQVRDPVFI